MRVLGGLCPILAPRVGSGQQQPRCWDLKAVPDLWGRGAGASAYSVLHLIGPQPGGARLLLGALVSKAACLCCALRTRPLSGHEGGSTCLRLPAGAGVPSHGKMQGHLKWVLKSV